MLGFCFWLLAFIVIVDTWRGDAGAGVGRGGRKEGGGLESNQGRSFMISVLTIRMLKSIHVHYGILYFKKLCLYKKIWLKKKCNSHALLNDVNTISLGTQNKGSVQKNRGILQNTGLQKNNHRYKNLQKLKTDQIIRRGQRNLQSHDWIFVQISHVNTRYQELQIALPQSVTHLNTVPQQYLISGFED